MNSPNDLRRAVEFTQASKVVEVIQKGDLLKSLRSLRELQPWNAPLLLSHLYRCVYVTQVQYLYATSIWPPDMSTQFILNVMLFFSTDSMINTERWLFVPTRSSIPQSSPLTSWPWLYPATSCLIWTIWSNHEPSSSGTAAFHYTVFYDVCLS